MKIVFFGEDSFSNVVLQSLIDDGHQVLAAVCPKYENTVHVRLEHTCQKHNIPFLRESDINGPVIENYLKTLNPDLFVSAHFKKLLKENIIHIPKFGGINLHPSLLPLYRGMSPQHWPIINGEEKTGITVHFINAEADTGDIILQHEVLIDKNWYVTNLQKKFLEVYKTIVRDAVRIIESGKGIYTKQDHLEGTYYGPLKRKDCQINLNGSCISAYNLIRAVSKPYSGAQVDNCIIWQASVADIETTLSINKTFTETGLYFTEQGNFIIFDDGILLIDKYEIKVN
jgi:methionyl-tRNA formyltransferase